MTSVQTLIDKAAETCGSRYKLAQRLHESEGNLSQMARGRRPVSPRLAARLAAMVGESPRDAALSALIEGEKDAGKQAELAALLGLPIPEQNRTSNEVSVQLA